MADIDGEEADALLSYYDCDICGFTFKKHELIRTKQGSFVCEKDYDIQTEQED